VQEIRAQFPALAREINGNPLSYLDSGASAQTPQTVIDAVARFGGERHGNVHRGAHTLAREATEAYEGARTTIARHIGASSPREVIFTANVTDAINLVANAWARANLGPGDRIVLTEMEHHSNIVPWYLAAQATGAELDWVGVDGDGRLIGEELDAALAREPKLVAVTHVSNVLGTVNDVAEIAGKAKAAGATVLIDGAQAAPKMALDVQEIGADFYGFTGHKLYGPTGVGVLWGRREVLESMGPFRGGGSMIRKVTRDLITWADLPARFEAGTPPITQASALGVAIEWLRGIGLDAVAAHEAELTDYAIGRLVEVPGLKLFGPPAGAPDRSGILSFELEGIHPHDVSEILDRHGVAVRAGHHCAQILMERLGVAATTRASLGVYNDESDIDRLIDALLDARRVFGL
jgi:cysteine desulfurase/selenocysteine lyase